MPVSKAAAGGPPARVADGIRTRDHRDHNPGLYQLSYRHRAQAQDSRASCGVLPRAAGTVNPVSGSVRSALDWLKPREHFDHPFWEIGVLIAVGAALALGA